ncbi:AAA family ATPase, partial [Nitriliruptoraceae bacterium ZYF776]|nr:AAA family ATPase [Profundirhabdus halotolerans]
RATGHVEAGRYRSPYRHILVDEFQDISLGRARLIKALKRQHPDARLFAVGDDWQSIYRFAGSDIHIMRNFGREFGGTFAGTKDVHCTIDLGRTFRSVDKIALSAQKFVLRNPAQITKTVVPAGTTDQPAIRVVWTRKDNATERLRDVLSRIASDAPLGDR